MQCISEQQLQLERLGFRQFTA